MLLSGRIGAEDEAALLHLVATNAAVIDADHDGDDAGPPFAVSLSADEQIRFDRELTAAAGAAARFPTPAAAAAAGYVQSSTQLPGIGTHWVKWSLIDKPFDPAQPAMLLFDQSPLHEPRLAGLSYWTRAASIPPGFTGPNDRWHRHSGMCFEDGWLVEENIADPAECAGQWLAGSDLWMLHAWVADAYPNSKGVFAPRNSALCPPDWQPLPDTLKCGTPGSAAAAGSHDDVNAPATDPSAYCHIGP